MMPRPRADDDQPQDDSPERHAVTTQDVVFMDADQPFYPTEPQVEDDAPQASDD